MYFVKIPYAVHLPFELLLMYLVFQYKPGLRTLFGDPSLACFIVLAQVKQTRIFYSNPIQSLFGSSMPTSPFFACSKKIGFNICAVPDTYFLDDKSLFSKPCACSCL